MEVVQMHDILQQSSNSTKATDSVYAASTISHQQSSGNAGAGVLGLVILPTRELAMQVGIAMFFLNTVRCQLCSLSVVANNTHAQIRRAVVIITQSLQ